MRRDPLPPVDHSAISYAAFKKDLYREHPDTKALGEQEVADIRARHDIHVLGTHVPKPLQSFR